MIADAKRRRPEILGTVSAPLLFLGAKRGHSRAYSVGPCQLKGPTLRTTRRNGNSFLAPVTSEVAGSSPVVPATSSITLKSPFTLPPPQCAILSLSNRHALMNQPPAQSAI